jgi:hypothetical protein
VEKKATREGGKKKQENKSIRFKLLRLSEQGASARTSAAMRN